MLPAAVQEHLRQPHSTSEAQQDVQHEPQLQLHPPHAAERECKQTYIYIIRPKSLSHPR